MINETDFKKQTIIPDISIEKNNDKWNIIVNNGRCPEKWKTTSKIFLGLAKNF